MDNQVDPFDSIVNSYSCHLINRSGMSCHTIDIIVKNDKVLLRIHFTNSRFAQPMVYTIAEFEEQFRVNLVNTKIGKRIYNLKKMQANKKKQEKS